MVRLTLWLLLPILLSCAPPVPIIDYSKATCRTECNEYLFGSTDCLGFQLAERRTVRRLEPIFPGLCSWLQDWSVAVMDGSVSDGSGFLSSYGYVGGLTHCDLHLMQINSDLWRHTSYSHEVAHAAQCPWGDPGHDRWKERGIIEAYVGANTDAD